MGDHTASIRRSPRYIVRPSAWPFMVQQAPAAPAPAVCHGVPRRQEVEFADGSKLWLLRVDKDGLQQLFVRELGSPAAGTCVDLRNLVPELATHLLIAHPDHVPTMVHRALRAQFQSASALIEAAVAAGQVPA